MSLDINKYVLDLLKSYIQWQIDNNFPPRNMVDIKDAVKYDFSNDGDKLIEADLALKQIPLSSMVLFTNKQKTQNQPITFSSNIFKEIFKDHDYVGNINRYKTQGVFPNNSEKCSEFYTSSLSKNTNQFFLSVYNNNTIKENKYKVFDIAYCNISGSGSYLEQSTDVMYPSKIMYKKYNMMCFDGQEPMFKFKNSKTPNHFYTIEFNRDYFKDMLDPGNIQIGLCPYQSTGSGSIPSEQGLINFSRIYTLIDNSRDEKEKLKYTEGIRDYYYLVSGSIKDGIYDEPTSEGWGIVFPKIGLIALDADVLDASCSFSTGQGSLFENNMYRLFFSISGSSTPRYYRTKTEDMFCRSSEKTITETYFCRLGRDDFNYSNNPTYVSGSNNRIMHYSFIEHPKAYITSIGLYNKEGDLIAIGKPKTPILKKANSEYIIQVKVRLN